MKNKRHEIATSHISCFHVTLKRKGKKKKNEQILAHRTLYLLSFRSLVFCFLECSTLLLFSFFFSHERTAHCFKPTELFPSILPFASISDSFLLNKRSPTDRTDRTWLANTRNKSLPSIFAHSRSDVSICSYSELVIALLIAATASGTDSSFLDTRFRIEFYRFDGVSEISWSEGINISFGWKQRNMQNVTRYFWKSQVINFKDANI